MANTKTLVYLVLALALVAFASTVSAYNEFGSITQVEVNGVDMVGASEPIAVFAGDTLPVRIEFHTNDLGNESDVNDVRIRAWVSGARDASVVTDRIDVLPDRTYSKLVSVVVPSDIDPNEDLSLEVTIESENGGMLRLSAPISLAAQRESYKVDVLDVSMDNTVAAGTVIPVDVVLKNRGRQFAEDTFVEVSIPALGLVKRSYFGDLSPVDQGGNVVDKEDAAEGRMFLNIPSNAPAGIYLVQIKAFNSDSTTAVTQKLAITGASANSVVVSPSTSKTFAVGEKGTYSLTLVNSGNTIRVYELSFKTASGLTVEADEPVVAIPAGSSKTVKLTASAEKAGKYSFSVDVSSDNQLVQTENYVANVEGSRAGSATVLLTVVLAVIFVVLLVVLIVLLTRKPKKNEEFGESYY